MKIICSPSKKAILEEIEKHIRFSSMHFPKWTSIRFDKFLLLSKMTAEDVFLNIEKSVTFLENEFNVKLIVSITEQKIKISNKSKSVSDDFNPINFIRFKLSIVYLKGLLYKKVIPFSEFKKKYKKAKEELDRYMSNLTQMKYPFSLWTDLNPYSNPFRGSSAWYEAYEFEDPHPTYLKRYLKK